MSNQEHDPLEQTDSRVIIEVPATKRESIDDGYDGNEQRFETRGTWVKTRHLDKSMINVDVFFSPDFGSRLPVEVEDRDGATYILDSVDLTIRFDCFPEEIREGARRRAGEDSTHEIRVLASWLWQAGGSSKDHIERGTIGPFWTALRNAVEEADDPPDWALCYGGDPDNWRHDEDPITTLDEAADYKRGGYQWVLDARTDEA